MERRSDVREYLVRWIKALGLAAFVLAIVFAGVFVFLLVLLAWSRWTYAHEAMVMLAR
jgi:hypothetical protein